MKVPLRVPVRVPTKVNIRVPVWVPLRVTTKVPMSYTVSVLGSCFKIPVHFEMSDSEYPVSCES